MNRRRFLALLAAPAIIRVADIMPVRALIVPQPLVYVPGSYLYLGMSQRSLLYAQREMLKWAKPALVLEKFAPDIDLARADPIRPAEFVVFRRPRMFTEEAA